MLGCDCPSCRETQKEFEKYLGEVRDAQRDIWKNGNLRTFANEICSRITVLKRCVVEDGPSVVGPNEKISVAGDVYSTLLQFSVLGLAAEIERRGKQALVDATPQVPSLREIIHRLQVGSILQGKPVPQPMSQMEAKSLASSIEKLDKTKKKLKRALKDSKSKPRRRPARRTK